MYTYEGMNTDLTLLRGILLESAIIHKERK